MSFCRAILPASILSCLLLLYFRVVFFTVAPRVVSFTPALSFVPVGETLTVQCCASGNPQPIISIDGNVLTTSFTKINGVYQGCAMRGIATSGTSAGTKIMTNCSVVLTQNLNCTTADGDGSVLVPQEAVENCNAALQGRASESTLNTVIGK